jgi:predicted dehydrogenase
MTNLGAHMLDIVDWALDLGSLKSVASFGGRFALQDNGETPDVQDALFDFGGWTASWSLLECARGAKPAYALEFLGTKGSLGISRSGFTVTPDPDVPPASLIPQYEVHPVGGPATIKPSLPPPGGEGAKESLAPSGGEGRVRGRIERIEDKSGDGRRQYVDHVHNLLDCIKSRTQPISDLESGHRTATACHLVNIALRLGRMVRWDSKRETIVGDKEAEGWLVRPYREPWDKKLRELRVDRYGISLG